MLACQSDWAQRPAMIPLVSPTRSTLYEKVASGTAVPRCVLVTRRPVAISTSSSRLRDRPAGGL